MQSHIDTNLTVVPSTAIGLVANAAFCDEMGKNGSGCYTERQPRPRVNKLQIRADSLTLWSSSYNSNYTLVHQLQ